MPKLRDKHEIQKDLADSIRKARTVNDRVREDAELRRDAEPFNPLPLGVDILRSNLTGPKP